MEYVLSLVRAEVIMLCIILKFMHFSYNYFHHFLLSDCSITVTHGLFQICECSVNNIQLVLTVLLEYIDLLSVI